MSSNNLGKLLKMLSRKKSREELRSLILNSETLLPDTRNSLNNMGPNTESEN